MRFAAKMFAILALSFAGSAAWARRGPRGASVTEVEVTEIPESFERFELRPTE